MQIERRNADVLILIIKLVSNQILQRADNSKEEDLQSETESEPSIL